MSWPSDDVTWADRGDESFLSPACGRRADLEMEDCPMPTKSEPAAMETQAPIHLPYGTAERSFEDFWGEQNPACDIPSDMPPYAVVRNSWDDDNSRAVGLRAAQCSMNPYECDGSFNVSGGACSARDDDVKRNGHVRFVSAVSNTNPTQYGADPFVSGGAAGGGVPVLVPYLGKKGGGRPLAVPDYVPPAGGGASAAASAVLPHATFVRRIESNFEQTGAAWGGSSVAAGGANEESIAGRYSMLQNFEASGTGPVALVPQGPSMEATPVVGGRDRHAMQFPKISAGGAPSGLGSDLVVNPKTGGRSTQNINFEIILPGGLPSGTNGGSDCNDFLGGSRSRKDRKYAAYMAPAAGGNSDYGGVDVAFGLTVSPRHPRTPEDSIALPGMSGGRGPRILPEFYVSPPNAKACNMSVDNSPDSCMLGGAMRACGASALLDFSEKNLAELAVSAPRVCFF